MDMLFMECQEKFCLTEIHGWEIDILLRKDEIFLQQKTRGVLFSGIY